MSFFWKKSGSDGSIRYMDRVSGNGIQAYYNTSTTQGGRCKVLTAASTLTAADNGTVYFLDSTTEFATTLPSPFLGAEFTFIVKTAPSGASYTVVTGSSANIIKGLGLTAEVTSASAGDSGTADDTISFVDGQAVAGDWVRCISDGTSWFVTGASKVQAGITFTQAST